MKWSFSQHMIFKECPRKWYFAYKMAHTSSTKDPIRKEAFYLKQLKTVDAWRGIIADKVISEKIIPSVSKNSTISLDESLIEARMIFDNQIVEYDGLANDGKFRAVEQHNSLHGE